MESRILLQEESGDEKSSIISLKEKLVGEVQKFESDEIKLKIEINACDEAIKEAKQRQLKCESFPLLDSREEDLIKDLDSIDISKSVILYDDKFADKCKLSPDEKMSWAVRSDAIYGSLLRPIAYVRAFSVWSGKDWFIRQTPGIGEYIAGPSTVSPESVMLKLKQILVDSNTKKAANHDFLKATKEKEELEDSLQTSKNFRHTSQLEIKRIENVNHRIADYDCIMNLTTKKKYDPFAYLEALLDAKGKMDEIKQTRHDGFEPFINERMDKLNAEIDAITQTIVHRYDHVADPEIAYYKLKEARRTLFDMGANIPDELYLKIQKLRLQKAWDTTYEVHKWGDKKREFRHYFMGMPQYLGSKARFAFACFLYTVGLGFIFTPIKNTLKLFTEAFPKRMDAYCENNLDKFHSSDFALMGHYFFKMWWVGLRPITSPIKSMKAAWHSCDKVSNKYLAWTGRVVLTGLSLALSFASLLAVIVFVPKVVLGLVGEAGGVVAEAAAAADSVILPAVPITYANLAAAARVVCEVQRGRLYKFSHAVITSHMFSNNTMVWDKSHKMFIQHEVVGNKLHEHPVLPEIPSAKAVACEDEVLRSKKKR